MDAKVIIGLRLTAAELREAIQEAEGGDGEAGIVLWREVASYREAGLDLSEMPEDLVAWFDRRLEELTDVPAATKKGSRVAADEYARQRTPHTPVELLQALCIEHEKKRTGKVGRPASVRRKFAFAVLARDVLEELTIYRKCEMPFPRTKVYGEVATRHETTVRRVRDAVEEAGLPLEEKNELFRSEPEAARFCRGLEEQGYRRVKGVEPLLPYTFKTRPERGFVFVDYF